jgi:colanic acid/amylovoran biosynthesis glycosyltransferase
VRREISVRRPRLLVLASTYPARPGDGTPGFVRDLALREAEEYDTVVLVPMVPGAPREENDGPLRVVRFRYFPGRFETLAHGAIIENLRSRRWSWLQVVPFLLAEAFALRRLVREHRPDVLHIHWILPQGAVALLTARAVPWLVTTLGGDVYALRNPLAIRLKRMVVRRARAVTTMNSDMRDRLVAIGAPTSTTHVLPMGADVVAVRAAAAGIAPVPGRLLFVGRLVEKKGLVVLLDALRMIPAGVPWSLDIVGDGPLRSRLEASAQDLPVRFLGQLGRDELSRSLGASSVVVVPSVPAASGDQDGLPVALLEAMAVGRPAVGSRLSGIDDAIVDGETGLLVPPGDAGALAIALEKLLTDGALRSSLGTAASHRSESFSVSAIGSRYTSLLDEVRTAR